MRVTHTHDTDNQSDIENSKIWMRWFSSWLSSQSCAALKSEYEYDLPLPDSSANIRRVIHPRETKGQRRRSFIEKPRRRPVSWDSSSGALMSALYDLLRVHVRVPQEKHLEKWKNTEQVSSVCFLSLP